jgi:hypothetical protein
MSGLGPHSQWAGHRAAWMVRRLRCLACRTWSQTWFSNIRFGFLYGTNSGGEVPNSSHCYYNLQWARTETSFLTDDLEAHPAPLTGMASDGNCGKHPWGGSPSPNGHQSSSYRARIDAAPSRPSPSTRWGFTLCRWSPRLVSCRGADLCLLIGVGLLLLRMWWFLHSCVRSHE